MDQVVPWANLIALISAYFLESKIGRLPFLFMTMLRTHFSQQWLTMSNPVVEEVFFDIPFCRKLA